MYKRLTRLEWMLTDEHDVADSLNSHTSRISGSPVATFSILDIHYDGKIFTNGTSRMNQDDVEYTGRIRAKLNRKSKFRVFGILTQLLIYIFLAVWQLICAVEWSDVVQACVHIV